MTTVASGASAVKVSWAPRACIRRASPKSATLACAHIHPDMLISEPHTHTLLVFMALCCHSGPTNSRNTRHHSMRDAPVAWGMLLPSHEGRGVQHTARDRSCRAKTFRGLLARRMWYLPIFRAMRSSRDLQTLLSCHVFDPPLKPPKPTHPHITSTLGSASGDSTTPQVHGGRAS